MQITTQKKSQRARMNEQITNPTVRLIGSDGEQIGVVSSKEALAMAEKEGLDLVEISPNAEPPVCRVMDHGKYLFEQNKKLAASRKKQKVIQVKEVKFRPGTEQGDYQVKLRNLMRFLENGDKTKVTIRFRGREMAHQELGFALLKRIEADLDAVGVVEYMPVKAEGRQLTMVFAPKKK